MTTKRSEVPPSGVQELTKDAVYIDSVPVALVELGRHETLSRAFNTAGYMKIAPTIQPRIQPRVELRRRTARL